MLQVAKLLASETTPDCLQLDEGRVRHRFVVEALDNAGPAVSVDDMGEAVAIRGSAPGRLQLVVVLALHGKAGMAYSRFPYRLDAWAVRSKRTKRTISSFCFLEG